MKIIHHAGGKNCVFADVGLGEDCMVIGISVSHPTHSCDPLFGDCPSVVAIVGNSEDTS